MRRIAMAALAVLALTACQAHAETVLRTRPAPAPTVVADPAPVEAPRWHQTGIYGVVMGGYDVVRLESGGLDINSDNLAAGGALGFRYRVPSTNIVLGGELDYLFTNVNAEKTINGLSITASPRHLVTARGVAGYALGPALFYVTGGLAYQDLELSAAGLGSMTEWQRGLAGGAGIHLELTQTIGIRLEGMRYQFDKNDIETVQDMLRLGAVIKLN